LLPSLGSLMVLMTTRATEWLDPLTDLVKPAQDRARENAAEQVIAAGG
jgi:hypothetical protein